MALILPDRVKVRSTTSGTGTFTLTTVMEGFRGFSAVGDGNETYYGIVDYAGHWEIGRGTWTSSSNTLSRDTVISSSNSNNKVNFPAGGKIVYSTFPSSLAQSIFSSTSTDSFSTISVAGQSDVNADSSTDTLTLVAGNNITITTDAVTDTITIDASGSTGTIRFENNFIYQASNDEIWIDPSNDNGSTGYIIVPGPNNADISPLIIENQMTGGVTVGSNGNQWSFNSNGSTTYPGDITQSSRDDTVCNAGVDTVVYTATAQYQHAMKLFVMVEGLEDGGSGFWETQACEIIAVRGFTNNVVHVTVYGVTYSGSAAIATFDGQWNATTNRIEITCRPVSASYGVEVSVHAIEMSSNN